MRSMHSPTSRLAPLLRQASAALRILFCVGLSLMLFSQRLTAQQATPADSLRAEASTPQPADTTTSAKPKKIRHRGAIDEEDILFERLKAYYNSPDSTKMLYAWVIDERIGEQTRVAFDSLAHNFGQGNFVDGLSLASGFSGNYGAPAINLVYFDRPDPSLFMYADGYWPYGKSLEEYQFINTKLPYANINYSSGGESQTQEQRFLLTMSSNFGKKLNAGFDVELNSARGHYSSQSAEQFNWHAFASYISDKYQFHFWGNQTNYVQAENGGIADDRYVTNTNEMTGGRGIDPFNIPVRFSNTWNRTHEQRYFFTHRYNLGYYKDKKMLEGFTPVASIIHTIDYRRNNRHFYSESKAGLDSIYTKQSPDEYADKEKTVDDRTVWYGVRNTVALSLREGFRPWVKSGLTFYADFDYRRFTLVDTLGSSAGNIFVEPTLTVGGTLSKTSGKLFNYHIDGNVGLTGEDAGQIKLLGKLSTQFDLWGKPVQVRLRGHFKNLTPTFYARHNHGYYYWWDNDFTKEQRIFAGGDLTFSPTRTFLSAGVENISNKVYFDNEGMSSQYSGSVQVIAARLHQNFKVGILGWENQILYQKSSNQAVLPLPELSIYSNLYIKFRIAKVLTIQPGIDIRTHSPYKAPWYDPATMQFRNQTETTIGWYPHANAYVNAHLKYTRFFFEAYNIGKLAFPKMAGFSLTHYPMNPFYFKFGISWNFYK